MTYMTKDFAALPQRKFTVYSSDFERKDAEERARQQKEHEIREKNAKNAKKSKND